MTVSLGLELVDHVASEEEWNGTSFSTVRTPHFDLLVSVTTSMTSPIGILKVLLGAIESKLSTSYCQSDVDEQLAEQVK